MTIESIGYAGTIEPNDGWANVQKVLGNRYWVSDDPTECVVSPVVGGTRQVQVSPGSLGGWGILDTITEAEVITLPTVPAGTTRWFTLVARRTWQTTQATTIVVGATASVLPKLPAATLNAEPGVIDDQLLAVFSLASTDAVPTLVYDLTARGAKDSFIMSPALSNLPNWLNQMAQVGNTIRTGNKIWTRIIDPVTLAPIWETDPTIVHSGPGFSNGLSITSPLSGWKSIAVLDCHGTRSGNKIDLLLQINHYSAANPISFSGTQGNAGDLSVVKVGNSDWLPPYDIPAVPFEYRTSSNTTNGGTGRYTTDGNFEILSGAPDSEIGIRTDGTWSIRAHPSWTREA